MSITAAVLAIIWPIITKNIVPKIANFGVGAEISFTRGLVIVQIQMTNNVSVRYASLDYISF